MAHLGFFNFGLVDLPDSLPANHRRELIGSGKTGTRQTISRMQDMVSLGKREIKIRTLVGELAATCPPKNYFCYAKAAHDFCRDRIRYVFDPSGVELIENPARILETKAADCDSIVILMCSLCENMGFPCRFVTIKADKARPDEFSHVFCEVKVPGRGWIASDPTQPQRQFGWKPGAEYPRKVWPASKDAPEDARESDEMAGLSSYQIPGVQDTPGLHVSPVYEFRMEPALVTTNPEEMELATLNENSPRAGQLPGMGPGNDFHSLEELQAMTAPQISMSGMGAETSKWAVLIGFGLALWLMSRGRR